MKKKLLSILLSLAMVITMMPMATMTAFATDSSHQHDDATFTPWERDNSLPTEKPGNYYLTKDVELSSTWNVPEGTFGLCLNGHVIKTIGNIAPIKSAGSGTVLNLYDCNGANLAYKFTVKDSENNRGCKYWEYTGSWEGTESDLCKKVSGGVITSDSSNTNTNTPLVDFTSGGTFNMYGGTICGSPNSGGVQVKNGYFTMHDGKICGNVGQYPGAYIEDSEFILNGGCICYNNAMSSCSGVYIKGSQSTFTMNGGSVSYNANKNDGAGVCVDSGTFNLNGGSISNNTADSTSAKGGGVYIKEAVFNMHGGSICNNKSMCNGGGVFVNGTANMSGGVIKNNVALYNGGGVFVDRGKSFTMLGGSIIGNSCALISETIPQPMGGGIYVTNEDLTIGGTAKIAGNKRGNIEDNVSLMDGLILQFASGNDAPNPGMHIGVTKYSFSSDKLFTLNIIPGEITDSVDISYLRYLFADDANQYIDYNSSSGKMETKDLSESQKKISVPLPENGVVYTDKQAAVNGEDITLTIIPNEGYELESLTVADNSVDIAKDIKKNEDGTYSYSFQMPNNAVSIGATFTKPEPYIEVKTVKDAENPVYGTETTSTKIFEIASNINPVPTYTLQWQKITHGESGDIITWNGSAPEGVTLKVFDNKDIKVTTTNYASAGDYIFRITNSLTDDLVASTPKTLTIEKKEEAKPGDNQGYTLDYDAETLEAKTGYEVSSSNNETASALTDDSIVPGQTYYVRKKARDDNHKASAWAEISVPARATAPNTTISSTAADSITVTAVTGAEYKVGDGSWQDDNVLNTSLSAATKYTVYVRIKATTTEFASAVQTINDVYTASAKPETVAEAGTIEYANEQFTVKSGYEISKAADPNFVAETLTDNKLAIEPGKTYYVRKAAVSGGAPASAALDFTTAARPNAPESAPKIDSTTDTTVTVKAESGQEYSKDNGVTWVSDNGTGDGDDANGTITFTDFEANSDYSIITRTAAVITAGNEKFASANSAAATGKTMKAGGDAPNVDTTAVVVTDTSVTLPTSGTTPNTYEYSNDGGTNWQDSNEFTGLTAATEYTFKVRVKETSDTMPSAEATVVVTTDSGSSPDPGPTPGPTPRPIPTPSDDSDDTKVVVAEETATVDVADKSEAVLTTRKFKQLVNNDKIEQVVIRTNTAEFTFDKKAITEIAAQSGNSTLVKVAAIWQEEESVKSALDVYELKVVAVSGNNEIIIGDFKGGKVTVRVAIPEGLRGKKLGCLYKNDKGVYSRKTITKQDNEKGYFDFTTTHFSSYVVAEASVAQKLLVNQTAVTQNKLKASKGGKVKISFKRATWDKELGKKVTTYQIYRATKKSGKYKKVATVTNKKSSKTITYTNKKLKKGTRYYYKVRGRVKLSSGKYAYTKWSSVKSAKAK